MNVFALQTTMPVYLQLINIIYYSWLYNLFEFLSLWHTESIFCNTFEREELTMLLELYIVIIDFYYAFTYVRYSICNRTDDPYGHMKAFFKVLKIYSENMALSLWNSIYFNQRAYTITIIDVISDYYDSYCDVYCHICWDICFSIFCTYCDIGGYICCNMFYDMFLSYLCWYQL